MDIKQILEELKVNNIEFVEELWSQPNSNEYHVICKFPNGRCYNYYNALEKGAPLSGPFKSIEEATEDLLANNPSSTKCWTNSEVESSSGNLELTYMTDFHLKHPVIDLEAANQYLSDDMTTYIKDDESIPKSCRDKINSISWKLSENRIDGHVTVEANDYLTKKESKSISEWISGQCSDGIGEGFEQQDFAYYHISELEKLWNDPWYYTYCDEEGETDAYEDKYLTAKFDWETNDYELVLHK